MADSVRATLTAAILGGSTGNVTEGQLTAATISRILTTGIHHNPSYTLAKSTTDHDYDMGELAAFRFIAVYSDKAVTLKVAASTNVTALTLPAAGMFVFLFDSDQSHLYLTNASAADDATLEIILAK